MEQESSRNDFIKPYLDFIQTQMDLHPDAHISTGMGCLTAHYNPETGLQMPTCFRCGKCLKFIRPEHIMDKCSGTHNPSDYFN